MSEEPRFEPINARLEAFSDGVFAVAITLLALNLAVDGPGHGSLAHQLDERWPAFAAYVVSFLTIGIVWVNHHGLIRSLRRDRESHALPYLNLLLLLFVVALPFGTATVAQYLLSNDGDAHLAAAVYSGLSLAMGISFNLLFVWSLRSGLTLHQLDRVGMRRAAIRFGIGNLGYATAIGVAFVDARASLAINALMAVYYVAERTPSGAHAGQT